MASLSRRISMTQVVNYSLGAGGGNGFNCCFLRLLSGKCGFRKSFKTFKGTFKALFPRGWIAAWITRERNSAWYFAAAAASQRKIRSRKEMYDGIFEKDEKDTPRDECIAERIYKRAMSYSTD